MLGARSHADVTGHCMVCCCTSRGSAAGQVHPNNQFPLARLLHAFCRGGLNQPCPSPWVAAVPSRMRELPLSSSPLWAACGMYSHAGVSPGESGGVCTGAGTLADFKSTALPVGSRSGDESCHPAWCFIRYLAAWAREQSNRSLLPGPSGDAREARAGRTACCWEMLLGWKTWHLGKVVRAWGGTRVVVVSWLWVQAATGEFVWAYVGLGGQAATFPGYCCSSQQPPLDVCSYCLDLFLMKSCQALRFNLSKGWRWREESVVRRTDTLTQHGHLLPLGYLPTSSHSQGCG